MGRGLKLSDLALLGRVGNAGVTPDSFPGLLRWYRADDFVGVDGNTIGGGANILGPWVDRKGSGDNASQTTFSGPVYKTNIFGSMPVIRFVNEFLNFAPGSLGDLTVVAVQQKTSTNSFLVNNAGNGHHIRRSFLGDNITRFALGGAGDQPANAFANPNNVLALTVRRSGTTVSFRENTTSRGSFVFVNNAFVVDQIGDSGGGGDIDIGELMIWNVPLSDGDLDTLYNQYLKPRYSVLP